MDEGRPLVSAVSVLRAFHCVKLLVGYTHHTPV